MDDLVHKVGEVPAFVQGSFHLRIHFDFEHWSTS